MTLHEIKRLQTKPKREPKPRPDFAALLDERRRAWLAMIDGVVIRNRADLARKLCVSRAYVTRVLGPMPRTTRPGRGRPR